MNEIIIPKKAVIDTCVLLDALMMHYIRLSQNINIIKKWEMIIYNQNENYKINYPKYLTGIKTFVTTSQVIGELQGLANSRLDFNKELKTSFWTNSVDYLKHKNLNEQLIELISLSEKNEYFNFVNEIGYVDTGLIELAKNEKLPIITNDEKTLIARSNQYIDIEIYCPKHLLNN